MICLIGYSGHGLVVANTALLSNMHLKYYADKKQATANPFSLEYVGDENSETFTNKNIKEFISGIGNNNLRVKLAENLVQNGYTALNVIHPQTIIATTSEMGIGNFISAGVIINPLAVIGNHCIINTGSIIEHECSIGNGVHIAPGAVLAGNVSVGDNSFIGANAIIKQGITVGKNVIVGAGSVVVKNIPDNFIVAGNPAKELNK